MLSLADAARAIDSIAHVMGGINVISTAQINTQILSAISQNTALVNVILNNCILFNCKVTNSVIKHCRLSDCVLENTPIQNSDIRRCQTITSPLAFRRFPAEIRSKIIWAALKEYCRTSGLTANLVVAFKGDQTLCRELWRLMIALLFANFPYFGDSLGRNSLRCQNKPSRRLRS
jgi:uncharacterized protein YjbI with pentapeptide repeats